MKKAVILGATGAVGKEILKNSFDYYDKIYVLGRKSILTIADNSKLEKIVVDFENLDFDESILDNADVFCAFGTTIKVAKTKENMEKIDFHYVWNFAKLCENKIKSFNVVSSLGANSSSKNFYMRMKGRLLDELEKLNLGVLRIYQPSVLIAKREDRILESIAAKILPKLSFLFIGSGRKFRPMKVEILGTSMIDHAINNSSKKIYTYDDFIK